MKERAKRVYFAVRGLFLRPFAAPGLSSFRPEDIRSILVIRIDRLGDTVVSLPAIEALRVVFPASRVTVLARPAMRALLETVPGVTVIEYRGFWGALRAVRKAGFSMAVDLLMDYTLRTALLCALSGAKVRAGFDIGARGGLFNIPFVPPREKKPMRVFLLDLCRAIAARAGYAGSIPDREPRLMLGDAARAAARAQLGECGRCVVGIHPGGYYPSQLWMAEGFAELGRRFAGRGCRVVLFGASGEKRLLRRIAGRIGPAATVFCGVPVDRLAGLLSLMDVLVCNNSGPLHLASALGVPTVSTMGPTDPALWFPAGDTAVVVRKGLRCSPCAKAVCAGHECMRLIGVEEMEQAVGRALAKDKKWNDLNIL